MADFHPFNLLGCKYRTIKMSITPINYDEVADTYDLRYERAYNQQGIAKKLLTLAHDIEAKQIAEANNVQLERIESMNSTPLFIKAVVDAVLEQAQLD